MKLSIITINYNNKEGLQKTIDSVLVQNFKDFEYIIIDGGSNDGSADIIKQHIDTLSYWVSEKDNGIYHAMNKGINKANGEYLLMLNSGDLLANADVLGEAFEKNNFNEDILYGEVQWENKGQFVCYGNYPEELSFQYFWQRSIGHQATFIKRSIHAMVGLYDEAIKYSSDWKFFLLSFQKHHLSFRYLPFVIAIGDNSGLTWNSLNFPAMKKEQEATIKKYFKEDYAAYKQFMRENKATIKDRLRLLKLQLKQKYKQTF